MAISADDYFASTKNNKPTSSATPKKSAAKPDIPVRSSPRGKPTASKPAATAKNDKAPATRRSTTSYSRHNADQDSDAYMDDGDDDDEDIFAADAKGGSKRKNDDYEEDESEDEELPKPKRIATRGRPSAVKKEEKEETKPTAKGRKRKSLSEDSEESEEEADADPEGSAAVADRVAAELLLSSLPPRP